VRRFIGGRLRPLACWACAAGLLAAASACREAISETGPVARGAQPDDPGASGRLDHPVARAVADPRRGELMIELPPRDVPGGGEHHHEAMVQTPLAVIIVPASGAVHGMRVEIVDQLGRQLPSAMLHHLNLLDLDHRELFLPVQLHVLAASKETGTPSIPGRLFGLPLERGQRLVAYAMLHNPTATAHPAVRVRLVLFYTPERRWWRPWPLFHAYPWSMDVMFPFGHPPGGIKAFDLPPGRSERSWEGRPAIAGKILAMGGHTHDHAVSLELTDVTTGEVIWRVTPHKDDAGRVTGIPVRRFYRWNRVGLPITPDHTYRVTVVYDNPTGRHLTDGGMGVVGGLFIPDRGQGWPAADTTDVVYRQDLHNTYGGEVGLTIQRNPLPGETLLRASP
jgi:hypothetical protein